MKVRLGGKGYQHRSLALRIYTCLDQANLTHSCGAILILVQVTFELDPTDSLQKREERDDNSDLYYKKYSRSRALFKKYKVQSE